MPMYGSIHLALTIYRAADEIYLKMHGHGVWSAQMSAQLSAWRTKRVRRRGPAGTSLGGLMD